MVKKKDLSEEYVAALEDELLAAIEREEELLKKELKFREFITKRIKRTKLYENIISDPNSRAGKVARAPRSLYRLIKNPEVRKSLLQKKTLNENLEDNHFLDPWMIDTQKREAILIEALEAKKKIALYFVEKPDSSTFRYRCYNTFEATKKSKKWQAVYFFKNELEVAKKWLRSSDVLIFGRQSGQEKIVSELTKLAHENGIKVGLDIDDLVFDIKDLDLVLETIGEGANRSYWLAYFGSVQAMAKKMDFFITTNNFLAQKLKKSYNKPVKIIRNSLNEEQVSASLVYENFKRDNDSGDFKIGYFSGSPTHRRDFQVAEPELIRFLKTYKNAVLEVVGFMKFSDEAKKLIEDKRIIFLPLTDFRKLQKLMAEVDINIAPLLLNDFTNCKSELKFFEAAIVETTTIASPNYSFSQAISDGENGFLAKPGEWYKKMEYLYKNPEENRKIAKKAKKYALEHYTGEEVLREIEGTYGYFEK